MKVSVILPARNEELLIKKTLTEVGGYLKRRKITYEILVVINGSKDKTEEIVLTLSEYNKNIKILKSHPGYGFALRKGLETSTGQYVIIYNVDFYDLRLIDLIEIDLYGKDFIIGSKRAHWSVDNRPWLRKAVSLLYNIYLSLFLGFRGSDTHGIKLLKKDVLKKIYRQCQTTSGIFDTELVLRAQRAGFKLADFPVVVDEKRPPRFSQRLLQTPFDIIDLTNSLRK